MAGPVFSLSLRGDLDAFTAPHFRILAAEVLSGQPPGVFLLDLTGLTFLDGTGARNLLQIGHIAVAHGHRWGIITQGNRWVHRLFEVLNWTEGVPLYEDWQSAHRVLCGEPPEAAVR